MSHHTSRYPVPKPIELVFKEVDGVSIGIDIYIPETATKENPVPVLLWWHGEWISHEEKRRELKVIWNSGWTLGDLSPHMLSAPAKYNLCIVSADYRLAPQTKLPSILSDCKSAIDFIQAPNFASIIGHRVDVSRLLVSGSSAGGWLALMAGTGIGYEASGLERPTGINGIVALYPIADLCSPFYSIKQRPVVYRDRIIDDSEVAIFMDPNTPQTSSADPTSARGMLYCYMLQEGIFKETLLDGTGIEPSVFCIAENVRSEKSTPPPTYIIVGNADTGVPHQQSLEVVDAYKSVGATVEYHELDGLDHQFDVDGKYELDSLYKFVVSVNSAL